MDGYNCSGNHNIEHIEVRLLFTSLDKYFMLLYCTSLPLIYKTSYLHDPCYQCADFSVCLWSHRSREDSHHARKPVPAGCNVPHNGRSIQKDRGHTGRENV